METKPDKTYFLCPVCDKPFTKRKNMYQHMRNIHEMTVVISGKLKCPLCSCNPIDYVSLREHLTDEHGCKLERESQTFPSIELFYEWKASLQQKTSYCYKRYTAPRALRSKQTKYYFICHRTGFFNPTSTGQRQLKRQGSNKINCTCPSTLDVTEDNTSGLVTVVYWKTHVGHSADFGHTYLSAEERSLIAGKIFRGMAFEEILDDIRDTSKGQQWKRIHFLTQRDLLNIKRNSEMLHKNATESIHQWVEEMKELGKESPVLYYKPAGENDSEGDLKVKDILLIIMTAFQQSLLIRFGGEKLCIDAGHGSDGYNFELITLLTMDDSGEGWPVAFCVTNQIDGRGLMHFFGKVKERCGNIACKVLTTVDYPAYINAWCTVMNAPQKCMFSSWHVDRKWRQQLSMIDSSPEKKVFVYKSLRSILMELNVERFETLLTNFLSELSIDDETKEFGVYFQNNYSKNTSSWAFCHKVQWDINANIYMESFHKAIEYVYLQGKKRKRLDTCIHALITLSRDKIFDYLSGNSKKKNGKMLEDIKTAHNKAKDFDYSCINFLEANTWEVKSAKSGKSGIYITRLDASCSCNLRCQSCNICIHMFSCTCADHLVKFNICMHIHACLLKVNLGASAVNDHFGQVINTSQSQKTCTEAVNQKMKVVSEDDVNKYLDMAISELKKDVSLTDTSNATSKPKALSKTRKRKNSVSEESSCNSKRAVSLPENVLLFVISQ